MIKLRPESIAQELADYQSSWLHGLDTLRRCADAEVGCCPCEEVYRYRGTVLYHYEPQAERLHPVPVVIAYALVNRPWIADLEDGRSLIQGLLRQGLDVYLMDWGYPNAADRCLGLDDYIAVRMDRCIDHVRREHALQRINLLGICQGGTMSLCYTALHQEKIANLVTTVTPVDFHTPGDQLSLLCRYVDVDLVVDTLGNVPGSVLNAAFLSLKPFALTSRKYVDMVDLLDDETRLRNFLRMEKWIFDSPDQAGEAYREFIRQFYQQNALVRGEVRIGGRLVDLGRIVIPVLNVYALSDHLVPPASSIALRDCIGSEDYETLEFPGGHIGLYVSSRAARTIPPAVAGWLRSR